MLFSVNKFYEHIFVEHGISISACCKSKKVSKNHWFELKWWDIFNGMKIEMVDKSAESEDWTKISGVFVQLEWSIIEFGSVFDVEFKNIASNLIDLLSNHTFKYIKLSSISDFSLYFCVVWFTLANFYSLKAI